MDLLVNYSINCFRSRPAHPSFYYMRYCFQLATKTTLRRRSWVHCTANIHVIVITIQFLFAISIQFCFANATKVSHRFVNSFKVESFYVFYLQIQLSVQHTRQLKSLMRYIMHTCCDIYSPLKLNLLDSAHSKNYLKVFLKAAKSHVRLCWMALTRRVKS